MPQMHWPDGCWATVPPSPFISWSNVWAGATHCLDAKYDAFAQGMFVRSAFLGGEWVPISDRAVSGIRKHFVEEYNFDPKPQLIRDVVSQLAWDNTVNPLADELEALRWDGIKRCRKFFVTYTGAKNSKRIRAGGSLFWRSLAARAMHPGCPLQTVICLLGDQGCGKSSLLQVVAGEPSRFTDQEIVHLPIERQQEALRARWIVEASELGGFDRHSIEQVKAFISRTHDRARGAWSRTLTDQPRTCVIVVTSNERRFLRDTTGNRRFLPIEVKRIDLAGVMRDREQLLAEAVTLHVRGLPLRLPRKLWKTAERALARYMLDDPFDEVLAGLEGIVVRREERIAFSTVWNSLGFKVERRTQALKRRVIDAMRRLGWRYDGQPFRIADETHRGFRRPRDRS